MLYSTVNTKIPNEPSLSNQRHTTGRRNVSFCLYCAYTVIEAREKFYCLSIVRQLFFYCSSIVRLLLVYCRLLFVYRSSWIIFCFILARGTVRLRTVGLYVVLKGIRDWSIYREYSIFSTCVTRILHVRPKILLAYSETTSWKVNNCPFLLSPYALK
jgi:hypothetical protein